MVAGDVVSALTSVATGTSVNYQPAAGVEVAIVSVHGGFVGTAPNTYPDVTANLYDGTNAGQFFYQNSNMLQKLFITNTRYLRLTNNNASTQILGYTGMQTK